MQSQSNTPKKSAVASLALSYKKSESRIVHVKQKNQSTANKSDTRSNKSKSQSNRTTKSPKDKQQKRHKEKSKKNAEPLPKNWHRGKELQRSTSNASSESKWQRGEPVIGDASKSVAEKSIHRRYRRMKERKLERAASNVTAETQESVNKKPPAKTTSEKEPKQEKVDSKSQPTQKDKINEPLSTTKVVIESSEKIQNAWSKSLKLAQIASESKKDGTKPPKEQHQTPKTELHEPLSKKEQEQLVDSISLDDLAVSSPSNVPAILPPESSHTTPPKLATSPTDTYPRVTPLPVRTYPNRFAHSSMRQFYNGFMDWQISPHHVVAMDCEMVGVGEGGKRSMLARVSLVDWHGTVLVDTFVAPTEHITDYRTFVSGIHPHHLISPEAMDFQTCRALVQSWLHAKPILVGHALVNDLEVLRLSHPWYNIRDSATYLPFTKPCCRGACPKRLRDLAQEELGISIQRDRTQHCSVVDARAAMELYKHKQNEWDLYVRIHRNYAMNWPYYPLGGREHGK